MQEKKIGFIGAGSMGQALISGFLQAGIVSREQIFANAKSENTYHQLKEQFGIQICRDTQELVHNCDLVFLAVKPQVLSSLLADLKGVFTSNKLVVSIVAGISLAALESALGSGVPVIRVMPNTPCLVKEGAAALTLGKFAKEEQGAFVERLLATVGKTVMVPETLMNAVTGLSGSGPAYVYLAIEALADGGVREGLNRKDALMLAAQTVLGAAKMVLETGIHPGVLKDRVTSPAGTTIEAVRALEQNGFRYALMEAVSVASKRSDELGGKKS